MSILYVCRKFEVMYDDNNKCKMHSMLETEFIFVSDDEDDEDDEEDEEEEEVDMMVSFVLSNSVVWHAGRTGSLCSRAAHSASQLPRPM